MNDGDALQSRQVFIRVGCQATIFELHQNKSRTEVRGARRGGCVAIVHCSYRLLTTTMPSWSAFAHCMRRHVHRVVPRLRHSPKHRISPSETAAPRIVLYHSDRECRTIHHMTYVANSATGRHLCCPIRSDRVTSLSMTHSFGIRFRHTNSNTNTMSKDTYSLVCQRINRVRKCF